MSAGFAALKRLATASKKTSSTNSSVTYQRFKQQVALETIQSLTIGESLPVPSQSTAKPYAPDYGGSGTAVGKETLM